MKFAVHTERGVFLIDVGTPDEAREIVRKKYECKIIKKVKAKKVTPIPNTGTQKVKL